MNNKQLILLMVALFFVKLSAIALPETNTNRAPDDSVKFYDGQQFAIIGKFHGENNYGRIPQKYQSRLRKEVWDLGQNSAGVGIRFRSNASKIVIKWTVTKNTHLRHMASTGVKGVDLYAYVNGQWQFVNAGFPDGKVNEYTVMNNADAIYREYLLNLPLYDGVDSLAIGVNTSAVISEPQERFLLDKKPVVYYGTSIAQGGCATRPGMAFTNILSRKLHRSFINLGFSGNGNIETSVGQVMNEIDAALYVIDCNANTPPELIYERTLNLVQLLKKERPNVPILLVEGFKYEHGYFVPKAHLQVENGQRELQKAYQALKKSDIKGLYYKKGDGLIGTDHEGTVDGVHPTDVGMERFAQQILPVIQAILKKNTL
jgi:hypothetical protein